MGLVDTSYQPWSGDFLPRRHRIKAMVDAGFRLAFVGIGTKIVLLMACSIAVVWLGVLFLAASVPTPLPFALGNNVYRDSFLNNFWYGLLLMLLTAMVGAKQISRDLKYNSVGMYFSKAITRADYVAGKFCVVALFLGTATLLPALALWIGQLAMGREVIGWAERFHDLGSIFAHSLVIVVPSTALVLALSSMSRTAYIPGVLFVFAYFGSRIAGWIFEERIRQPWCKLVAWQNLTAHLGDSFYQDRVLKDRTEPILDYSPWVPAGILIALTVVSIAVVLWRLRRLEANE